MVLLMRAAVTKTELDSMVSKVKGRQDAVQRDQLIGMKLVINARSESVMEKPMFCESILHNRIVIPAAGFYEWNVISLTVSSSA